MKHALRITSLSVFLIIVASCSNTSSHRFSKKINNAGVEVCTSSGGPKYADPLYTLEETLSLGGEAPEPKLFQPFGVLVDDERYLYFIDEQRIKKFSPHGEFVSYIGRIGQGPGEITNPRLAVILGDTLYADQFQWSGSRKYELFKTDGTYIDRIVHPRLKVEPAPGQRKYTAGPLGPFSFLFYVETPLEPGFGGPAEWSYGIADRQGNVLTMLEVDIEPFTSWIRKENGGTVAPYTVGAESYIFDSIYILSGVGARIDQFTLNGELKRILHLQFEREPVDDEDIAGVLKSLTRPGVPAILDAGDFPEYKPVACSVIEDDQGRLWVKKGADYYSGRKGAASYMIFSQAGEYLADQVFPCDVSVIKGGKAYGFTATQDDEIIFKCFSLIGSGKE